MSKSIRQYIKEEILKTIKEQQLNLPFKEDPVKILAQYVEEKSDDVDDTLSNIEVLLDENNLKNSKTIAILNRIEHAGKQYVFNIKLMHRLLQKGASK